MEEFGENCECLNLLGPRAGEIGHSQPRGSWRCAPPSVLLGIRPPAVAGMREAVGRIPNPHHPRHVVQAGKGVKSSVNLESVV